jgi:hypothetical protein
MSDSGVEQMREVTKAYASWAAGLDSRWSGLGGVLDASGEGLQWTFGLEYFFLGGADEIDFQDVIEQLNPANFSSFGHNVTAYEDAWSVAKASVNTPPYSPAPLLDASFTIESSLIDQATMKDLFPEHLVSTYLKTSYAWNFFHDIPGDSAEPTNATSISQAFREAVLLLEYPGSESLSLNTYFSESSYELPGTSWRERYWGKDKYQKLLSVKNKFDPQGLLWCHHCVGSEDEEEAAADRRRLGDFLV